MYFTVIIPTMWRFPLFPKFLEDLVDNTYVDQVIIINNDNTRTPELLKSDKITLIDKGKNLKVNPSWNLAVRLSRNEDICIVNDDLIYDLRIFKALTKINQNNFGAAGMALGGHLPSSGQPELTTGIIDIKLLEFNYYGFGQFMYIKKRQWVNIPYECEFGFGDDWVVQTNISKKLLVYNIYECFTKTKGYMTMREVNDRDSIYEKEKSMYNEYIELFRRVSDENVRQYKSSLEREIISSKFSILLTYFYNSESITIYGKNINEVSKIALLTGKKIRAFNTVLDTNLQRTFLQLIKYNDIQYELVDILDNSIEQTDVLIATEYVDINQLTDKVNNYIIVTEEIFNHFRINNGWSIENNINGLIILKRNGIK